jgi:ferredoxin
VDKETESSRPEDSFDIDWSARPGDSAAEGEPPGEEAHTPADELPVEPPLAWEQGEGADYDESAVLTALLDFHRYGRRQPHAVPDARAARPIPALLHPYRDLAAVRHEYPLCVTGAYDAPVRPLTAIVDEVIAEVTEEGELGERRRRHVLQVEEKIRRLSEESPGARLGDAWKEATDALLEAAPNSEKRELLQQSFAAAQVALPHTKAQLLPCTPETPLRVFLAAATAYWERKCSAWREDLESLVERTRNILLANDIHTADSQSPDHLRASTADEDLDFEAMSDLLKESRLSEPLPEARRKRVQHALDTILKMKPIFDGTSSLFDTKAKLPFDLQPVRNVCAAARDRHQSRMRTMVDFFKALRVAELEVENRYKEEVHDRFFAQFDARHLTEGERSFCPPVVVVLDAEFFAAPDLSGLLDLLASGFPVKVFAELGDLGSGDGTAAQPAKTPAWPARLAGMALALNDVYVSQTPASQPTRLTDVFVGGFEFEGSSLMTVFTGSADTHPSLPVYLSVAAAAESRLFPAFRFDPSRGATLAERMDISDNAHVERAWPSDTFTYQTDGGEERTVELEFTPADSVSQDVRFDDHFWRVDPAKWHQKMTPLGEYLRHDPAEGEVPYLTAVGEDGTVERVVVTAEVIDMVRRVAASWRNLQESGGVDNSFAVALLESERDRLAEEKQREIEEVEKKYTANLERDLGDLTQEIVQRIAANLLSEGAAPATIGAPAPFPAAKPAKPAPQEEAPAAEPEQEAVEEEEEEAVSFDDPYIDTPLCTSCNECTKLNGKMFAYDGNKQAFIADADAGTFRELVTAAEKCPVKIIHPGKPRDPSESGLDDLVKRAESFN